MVDELRVMLHERLAVRGDRDDVVELRDGVADPDLDRAEARMKADVPPNVRVVLDAAGLLELVHDLRVVGVVAEPRWRSGAGNAAKTMWRDERSPVGSPRQNGELAESATSSGR